jgi:hypothetical protein
MYSSSIVIVAGFWLFLERLGFMRSQIIYYLGTTIVPTYMYIAATKKIKLSYSSDVRNSLIRVALFVSASVLSFSLTSAFNS